MSRDGRPIRGDIAMVDHTEDELLACDAARRACKRLPAEGLFLMPTNRTAHEMQTVFTPTTLGTTARLGSDEDAVAPSTGTRLDGPPWQLHLSEAPARMLPMSEAGDETYPPTVRPEAEPSHTQDFPPLRKVDAVTVPVPDLDSGLAFYRDHLGHELIWRNDTLGQAGLRLPESDTEILLTTRLDYVPNWLVSSADDAANAFHAVGGRVISAPFDVPVGRVAVVADPFDNILILIDLSKGTYTTDEDGSVTGVA